MLCSSPLRAASFPASVSMIVRREALGTTAPWDRLLKVVMDWDLYLGLLGVPTPPLYGLTEEEAHARSVAG